MHTRTHAHAHTPVSEGGAPPEEHIGAADPLVSLDGAEEAVVLHTRLPQVLAGTSRVDLEDNRLIVVLSGLGDHVQDETLVLVLDGRDTDPEGRGGGRRGRGRERGGSIELRMHVHITSG